MYRGSTSARAGALAAVLLGAAAGALEAQTPGRLSLTLLDAAGSPLPAANVRLTCPELERFEQARTSDAKGRVLLTFPDAHRRYRLRIERAGFQPVDMEVEAVPGELLRKQMSLVPVAPAPPPAAAAADHEGAGPERPYNAGVEALQAGEAAAAVARFEEALRVQPSFVPALVGLALAHLRSEDLPAAAAAAEKATAVDPAHSRARQVRAQVSVRLAESGAERFDAGQVEQAQGLLERALELDSENPQAHYRLGICHVHAGRTTEAQRHLRRFLELAPDDPSAPRAAEMLRYLK